MDYIREFDIKLDKEYYYAGETISGIVILDTTENFKLRSKFSFQMTHHCIDLLHFIIIYSIAVRVILRGKAHAEWKVILSGDRRTVRIKYKFSLQKKKKKLKYPHTYFDEI